MPKAKTRHERSVQVLRWLKSEFKMERLKRLEWIDDCMNEPDIDDEEDKIYGRVIERGDDLVIILCDRCCTTKAITVETVIHEAAHAYLWDAGLGYFHGDRYWKRYGRMQDAYDHHGWSDSRSFEFE